VIGHGAEPAVAVIDGREGVGGSADRDGGLDRTAQRVVAEAPAASSLLTADWLIAITYA
jgi:hypothetical protein